MWQNLRINLFALVMFISKFTSCNGLKYHKIRYKSRENNPIKPFQFPFTCVRPVFLYVTCSGFWRCTSSTERSRLRGLRGNEICFYCAIALWRDGMSDEKHEEIRRLGSALIEKNPTVFQPLLFSSNSARQQQILSTCFIFSDRFRVITQTSSRSLKNWRYDG